MVHLFPLCCSLLSLTTRRHHSPESKKEKRYKLRYIYIPKKQRNLAGIRSTCISVTLIKQSWKCIRSSAAGTVLSLDAAFLTAFAMIDSAWGHVLS